MNKRIIKVTVEYDMSDAGKNKITNKDTVKAMVEEIMEDVFVGTKDMTELLSRL